MTGYTGRTKYILGEFGIEFTLIVAVLAVYFWMRRAEVAQPSKEPLKADFSTLPRRCADKASISERRVSLKHLK